MGCQELCTWFSVSSAAERELNMLPLLLKAAEAAPTVSSGRAGVVNEGSTPGENGHSDFFYCPQT